MQFASAVPKHRCGALRRGMQQDDLPCCSIVPWFDELPIYAV
jgi:hypothetical protein